MKLRGIWYKKKLIATTTVVLLLLLWIVWKPFRVQQHLRGAEKEWEAMSQPLSTTADGTTGPVIVFSRTSLWDELLYLVRGFPGEPWERYEYHRDALVDLGYFQHRKFRFNHIVGRTPEASKLWELACCGKGAYEYPTLQVQAMQNLT